MTGTVNSVLAYLAARSRGDSSFGAPGEPGAAPPLRPRLPPGQAGDGVDGLPSGFVEEVLETRQDTPPPGSSKANVEAETVPGFSVAIAASSAAPPAATPTGATPAQVERATITTIAASAQTEATPSIAAQARATSPPAQTPTPASALAAAPIQASRPALPPRSAASEGRTPLKRQAVSAAPTSSPRPDDRSASEASAPSAAQPVAGPRQADTLRPPPAILQREVSVPLTPAAEATVVEARPTPRAERPLESAPAPQRGVRETPAAVSTAPPQVQITIGRVEIRAAASPPSPPPRGPAMSLDDYLARRAGG